MYERHTFWGVVFGGFTYWTSFNSVNQTMVQRYMSLPSLKKAKQYDPTFLKEFPTNATNLVIIHFRSIFIFTIGVVIFISVCCYAGILIYARFYDCDPKTAGLVEVKKFMIVFYRSNYHMLPLEH